MENKKYFSQIKEDYQEAVEYSGAFYGEIAGKLGEILHGKVADFGNGNVVHYSTEKIDKLLCVDIINEKRVITEGKKEFIYGDFYDFDFPEDLDFALAHWLLHHLPEDDLLEVALHKLNKALGIHGKFVIVENVMPGYMEAVQNALRPVLFYLLRLMKKPGLRFFSLASLTRLLKRTGFDQISVSHVDVVGWIAPAPVLFPRLRMPGWLYPLKCIVIEASSSH